MEQPLTHHVRASESQFVAVPRPSSVIWLALSACITPAFVTPYFQYQFKILSWQIKGSWGSAKNHFGIPLFKRGIYIYSDRKIVVCGVKHVFFFFFLEEIYAFLNKRGRKDSNNVIFQYSLQICNHYINFETYHVLCIMWFAHKITMLETFIQIY